VENTHTDFGFYAFCFVVHNRQTERQTGKTDNAAVVSVAIFTHTKKNLTNSFSPQ